jgi:1,4-dihydroxy-6-naphthoate synthase
VKLSLAYSPCPNDTFIFHGIANGQLTLPGCTFDVYLHDVETLNQHALKRTFDITKLSFYAYLKVAEKYRLLRSGAALGFGNGPLLVSSRPIDRDALRKCRVAVPGELTTAHLLFQLYAPEATNKIFTTYDRIMELITSGEADCGIIIHESRFVFERAGLLPIVDLGQWWEEETGAAIPLGGIAIRNDIPNQTARDFDALVKQSIELSRAEPEATRGYIRQHAQELEEAVVAKHIDTFVNDFSIDLGAEGDKAVAKLEEMARAAGII